MKIEPSGVVEISECDLRLPGCLALMPAPVMAIWAAPRHEVTATVCRFCLTEMVRLGEWENPGAKLKRRFDIAVYSKDERLRLVIDVKDHSYKHEGDTEQWATRIRRNLVRHSAVPIYVHFLLAVYPAPFYLWLPDDAPDTPPRYRIDVQAQMPLLQESGTSDYQQQVDAVANWLTALVNAPADTAAPQAWFDDSGLRDATRGGRIVRRAAPAEARELQAA